MRAFGLCVIVESGVTSHFCAADFITKVRIKSLSHRALIQCTGADRRADRQPDSQTDRQTGRQAGRRENGPAWTLRWTRSARFWSNKGRGVVLPWSRRKPLTRMGRGKMIAPNAALVCCLSATEPARLSRPFHTHTDTTANRTSSEVQLPAVSVRPREREGDRYGHSMAGR